MQYLSFFQQEDPNGLTPKSLACINIPAIVQKDAF